MTATTEKKEVTLKPEVLALAEQIRKDMKLDKTGVAVVSPDLYVQLLPEGITKEIVETVQNHNGMIAAAGLYALGQESLPLLKKHKDLPSTSLKMPTVGKDNFEFGYLREKEVRNVATGEAVTKYGHGTVAFNIYSTDKNVGEVKKAKQLLADAALAAFGS